MRLILQPNGRVLLGRTADLSGDPTVAVVRLTGSGQLDGSFATDGVASQKVGDSLRLGDIAVQDDGRVVVVGVTQTLSQRRAAIMRLLPNGNPRQLVRRWSQDR